ncbi:beta-lactamase/transpeptidase-like protein [Pseudohyphozyma bogoriensis]|nr:beta-lactamase/transpeptidase-like protein [Pseudohyphozyma bogoriensis]
MTLEAQLQSLLEDGVAAKAAPGLIAVVFNRDKIIAKAAVGVRNVDTQAPIDTSTIVWQASMSKAVVSFAVLRAVEEKGFDIDSHDELVKILPEFKIGGGHPLSKLFTEKDGEGKWGTKEAKKGVTLRHLLSHTSGLAYDFNDEATTATHEPLGPTPSNLTGLAASVDLPRHFEAGEGWMYGHGAAWVGIFLERLTGSYLRVALQDLVFTPLGIPPHTLDVFISPEMRENFAVLHTKSADKECKVLGVELPQREFKPPEGVHVHADSPLYGSILSFAKFAQCLLNKSCPHPGAPPLLNAASWNLATSDALAPLGLSLPHPVVAAYDKFIANDMVVFSKGGDESVGEGWTLLQTAYNRCKSVTGRTCGTLSWSGLANSYFFVDVDAGVGGVIAASFLPWADKDVYDLRDGMEKIIYEHRKEWEN